MNENSFFDNKKYFSDEGYYIKEEPTYMAVSSSNDIYFYDNKDEAINSLKDSNDPKSYVAEWVKGYDFPKLVWEYTNESFDNPNITSEQVENFIEDLYDLRKNSIASEGEYGLGNLVFKEFRNRGYLDNLKELRKELLSKELSLEKLEEPSDEELYEAKLNETHSYIIKEYRKQAGLKDSDIITEDNLDSFALNRVSANENYDVEDLKDLLLNN